MSDRKSRILFLSNSSPGSALMAERLANTSSKFSQYARGAFANDGCINANTLLVLVEDGIECSTSKSRLLTKTDLEWADLLVVLGEIDGELPALASSKEVLRWALEYDSPQIQELNEFRQLRDEVKNRLIVLSTGIAGQSVFDV